jgi:hypothetical protein
VITITDAMEDPHLFGQWFDGESWDVWRAVLKGAFADQMTPREVRLFRCVADRDPPERRVRELWAIAGRRGGKDSIASLIAACMASFIDYTPLLRPGERATVFCLAVDRQQAKIVLNYTRAYFAEVPLLRGMVERETADGLELTNGAEIVVSTNSFRAVRGRSIACAIFDEENSAPEVMLHALDPDEDFVQVPLIPWAGDGAGGRRNSHQISCTNVLRSIYGSVGASLVGNRRKYQRADGSGCIYKGSDGERLIQVGRGLLVWVFPSCRPSGPPYHCPRAA